MTDSQPRVSVVVRALNEERHLPRLFHALANQSYQPYEVVLVDSGSTDDSVAIATEWGARVVHIAPEDFTFGASLNRGCEAASGDLLLLASAHVFPQSTEWIARLIEPFTHDDNLALAYGGQDGDHSSNFGERQLLRSWFPLTSNPDQQDPFCNNANCMIRRDIWTGLPYEEELPGLEDIAWANQVLQQDYRLAYVGDARVVHLHSERLKQVIKRYEREAVAYRSIFNRGELETRTAAKWLAQAVLIDLREATHDHRPIRSGFQSLKFRTGQYVGAARGHGEKTADVSGVVARMFAPNSDTKTVHLDRT